MTQALRANCIRVLVVEDNRDICENIGDYLGARGHITDFAHDGISAMHLALTEPIDVIVLDLMLPGMDGLTFCRKLRLEAKRDTPVLMLTARDTLPDKLAGFDAGADDYLVKPFDLDEVLARMRAVVRRHAGRGSPKVAYGALSLDPVDRSVRFRGEPVSLSAREYAVLEALARNPGALVPRDKLVDSVYGWGEEVESNAIEVYLHHLRRKLSPELILNVRGVGYRLVSVD